MKSKTTKLLALLMAVAIVFSLAACGKEDETETTTAVGETTTMEGDSTAMDETTVAGETTTIEDETTTMEGDTTAAGQTTTAAVNTVPSTKAEILAAYTAVMDKAKVTDKPGYTKIEYQDLPENKRNIDGAIAKPLLNIASGFMTTEEDAKKAPSVNTKGGNMNGFPVKDAPNGCMITDTGAIKTAKCEVLSNGNYKITIVLVNEKNPEHYISGEKASSNTGNMFTPLSKTDIDPELNSFAVKLVVRNAVYDLGYYDCTSTLVYDSKTSQIVTLDQDTYTKLDLSGKVLGTPASGDAVLEMHYKFYDFNY